MFCAITPTRGNRPEFLNFCKTQIGRMNTKPDAHYIIDYEPESKQIDLIDRVRKGIELAAKDGHKFIFIIEDDDYYPKDYFDELDLSYDFVGIHETTYYNIRNRSRETYYHPKRSSLFCTGFKVEALNNFIWPERTNPFLDLELWKYADHRKTFWNNCSPVGIKHGLGLTGGNGHKFNLKFKDPNLSWLKDKVDSEAFDFYNSMSKFLKSHLANKHYLT